MQDPIDTILRHEGGFVNHPNDRGGPTKFGVTQKTYSHWLGRSASLQEVKNMDEATAREIYESMYLTGPRIHTLPEPPQTLVLDMAINHGPRTAIRLTQKVVNEAGFGPITADGRIGPQTRAAIQRAAQEMGPVLQNAIVEERINYYHRIVENNPSQEAFIRGWLRRAESFRIPLRG